MQKQIILLDAKAYMQLMLERLKRIGGTYSRLSYAAGFNPSQVCKWIKGHVEPRISMLQRLELALRKMEAEHAERD